MIVETFGPRECRSDALSVETALVLIGTLLADDPSLLIVCSGLQINANYRESILVVDFVALSIAFVD